MLVAIFITSIRGHHFKVQKIFFLINECLLLLLLLLLLLFLPCVGFPYLLAVSLRRQMRVLLLLDFANSLS